MAPSLPIAELLNRFIFCCSSEPWGSCFCLGGHASWLSLCRYRFPHPDISVISDLVAVVAYLQEVCIALYLSIVPFALSACRESLESTSTCFLPRAIRVWCWCCAAIPCAAIPLPHSPDCGCWHCSIAEDAPTCAATARRSTGVCCDLWKRC